jgi:glutamine amidotransferase
MIVIVDYQTGNLASIVNMLKKNNTEAVISSDINIIQKAEKLILPGVGAFDYGMQKLKESGLIEVLNHKVLVEKTPVLGICLGVQLFTKRSEEGKLEGLGWIDAETVRFKPTQMSQDLRIPHMGWCDVQTTRSSRLFTEMFDEPRFYFVHSYHLQCKSAEDNLIEANYGYRFTAGVEHENIVGVQFHPEKSHKFGMKLLKNFVDLY